MKKFNDILNEDNEGKFDNKKTVDLIVAEYDFIKNGLTEIIRNEIEKVLTDAVDIISDDSFASSYITTTSGENVLKYLGFTFRIHEEILKTAKVDIGTYFTEVKNNLTHIFNLRNDAITIDNGWYLKFQIDYETFKKSDFYRSIKGIDKYNL